MCIIEWYNQEYGKIIHYDYFIGYETENKNIEKFDYKKEQFERKFLNLNGKFAKFCLFGNPEKIVPKFWKVGKNWINWN